MGSAFNLGKIFGIQFRLHYSWFIIFILITVSLSWQYFPSNYPDWPLALYWIMGLVTSLLFFTSVVAHELAHSLVGRANGIPIKSITLFIFGGIARMTREVTKAKSELLMAAAGPACSLAIGGLFALLWFFTRNTIEPIAVMALWLAGVNIVLAVFNLIPGFPLDGGRVFRSLLWHFTGNYKRATRVATQMGRGVGYSFILSGILIVFLHPFGLSWFDGLWIAFIGLFLENAASTSYRQVQWREALRGLIVSQVMLSNFSVVSPTTTVNQLIQEYVFARGQRCFLVADEGGMKGILTLQNIQGVSQQNKDVTQAKEIMTPIDKLKVAYPDEDVLDALERMNEADINQMPVVSAGRVVGLITRDNLMIFLSFRSKLGRWRFPL